MQEVTVQKLSANAGRPRPVEVDSRKAEIGAESRWPFLATCVFHGRESNGIPDQWRWLWDARGWTLHDLCPRGCWYNGRIMKLGYHRFPPAGPDGLGWQIRQRIWGERLSNCLWESWKEQEDEGGLLEGWECSPKARRNKGLPHRDYTKGIHIVNVRVTDWIALLSCPHLQHCFSHSVFPWKRKLIVHLSPVHPMARRQISLAREICRNPFVNVSVKTKWIMVTAERFYITLNKYWTWSTDIL